MDNQTESAFIDDINNLFSTAADSDFPLTRRIECLEILRNNFHSQPFRHILQIYFRRFEKKLLYLSTDEDDKIVRMATICYGNLTVSLSKKSLGEFFLNILKFLGNDQIKTASLIQRVSVLKHTLSQSENQNTIAIHYIKYISQKVINLISGNNIKTETFSSFISLINVLVNRFAESFSAYFEKATLTLINAFTSEKILPESYNYLDYYINNNTYNWRKNPKFSTDILSLLVEKMKEKIKNLDGESDTSALNLNFSFLWLIAVLNALRIDNSIPGPDFVPNFIELIEKMGKMAPKFKKKTENALFNKRTPKLALKTIECLAMTYGVIIIDRMSFLVVLVLDLLSAFFAHLSSDDIIDHFCLVSKLSKIAQIGKNPIKRIKNAILDQNTALFALPDHIFLSKEIQKAVKTAIVSLTVLAESPLKLIQSISTETFNKTKSRQKQIANFEILANLDFLSSKKPFFPPEVPEFLFKLFLSLFGSASFSDFQTLLYNLSLFRLEPEKNVKQQKTQKKQKNQKKQKTIKTGPGKNMEKSFLFLCDDVKAECLKALCELRRFLLSANFSPDPSYRRPNESVLFETMAGAVFNSLLRYAKPKNEYGERGFKLKTASVNGLLEWVADEFGGNQWKRCDVCDKAENDGENGKPESADCGLWLCEGINSFKCCFKRIVVQNEKTFFVAFEDLLVLANECPEIRNIFLDAFFKIASSVLNFINRPNLERFCLQLIKNRNLDGNTVLQFLLKIGSENGSLLSFFRADNKYPDACEKTLKNFFKTSVHLNQKTDFSVFSFVFEYTIKDENFCSGHFYSAQNVLSLHNVVRSVFYGYSAAGNAKQTQSLSVVLNHCKTDPVMAFRVLLMEFCKICVRNKLNSPLGKPNETLTAIKGLFENANGLGKLKAVFLFGFISDLMRMVYSLSMEPNLGLLFGMQREENIKSFFESNREVCSQFFRRLYLPLFQYAVENQLTEEIPFLGENCLEMLKTECKNKNKAFVQKTQKILFLTIESYVAKNLPSCASELINWFKTQFSAENVPLWANGLQLEAAGRFDEARRAYSAFLEKAENDDAIFFVDRVKARFKKISFRSNEHQSGADESRLSKVFRKFLEKSDRTSWIEKMKNKHFRRILKGIRKNGDCSSEKISEIVRIFHFFSEVGKPNNDKIKMLVKTASNRDKLRYSELFFYILKAKFAMETEKSGEPKFLKELSFIAESLKAVGNNDSANLLLKANFGKNIITETQNKKHDHSDFISEVSATPFTPGLEIEIKKLKNFFKNSDETVQTINEIDFQKLLNFLFFVPVSVLADFNHFPPADYEINRVFVKNGMKSALKGLKSHKNTFLRLFMAKLRLIKDKINGKLLKLFRKMIKSSVLENKIDLLLEVVVIIESFGVYIDFDFTDYVEQIPAQLLEFALPQILCLSKFVKTKPLQNLINSLTEKLIPKLPLQNSSVLIIPSLISSSFGNRNPVENTSDCLFATEKFVNELMKVALMLDEVYFANLKRLQKIWPKMRDEIIENLAVFEENGGKSLKNQDFLKNAIAKPFANAFAVMAEFKKLKDIEPKTTLEKDFFNAHSADLRRILEILREIAGICLFEKVTMSDRIISSEKRIDLAKMKIEKMGDELMALLSKTKESIVKEKRLDLGDISPYLAEMRDFEINIPSLNGYTKTNLKLARFSQTIKRINSKTRPIKLTLLAKSGQKHKFLLKAKEDLTLDERVMQFLNAANFFLRQSTAFSQRPLCVTTYPVVPLPNGCGLIRWIDGVRPLHSFVTFESNNPKQTDAKIVKIDPKTVKTGPKIVKIDPKTVKTGPKIVKIDANPVKPAENIKNGKKSHFFPFQSGSNPMSRDVLLKRTACEGRTPLATRLEAFRALGGKVDGAVLAKALWLSSATPGEFFEKKVRFVRSAAAVSVVGHVLGLGDRHLGNILLDLRSGQLVHVDYNVCFEKGLRLSIPETVPFRLTKIIRGAFGPGDWTEFEESCEETLRTLVAKKNSLLAVLRPLCYFPLGEWRSRARAKTEKALQSHKGFFGDWCGFLRESQGDVETGFERLVTFSADILMVHRRKTIDEFSLKAFYCVEARLRTERTKAESFDCDATDLFSKLATTFIDTSDDVNQIPYWTTSQILFPKLVKTITSDDEKQSFPGFGKDSGEPLRLKIGKIIDKAKDAFETVWEALCFDKTDAFDLQSGATCPTDDFFRPNKFPIVPDFFETAIDRGKNSFWEETVEAPVKTSLKSLLNALKSDFSPSFGLESAKRGRKAIQSHVSALRSVSFSIRMALRDENRPARIYPLENNFESKFIALGHNKNGGGDSGEIVEKTTAFEREILHFKNTFSLFLDGLFEKGGVCANQKSSSAAKIKFLCIKLKVFGLVFSWLDSIEKIFSDYQKRFLCSFCDDLFFGPFWESIVNAINAYFSEKVVDAESSAKSSKIDFLMKIEEIFANFGANDVETHFADFKQASDSVWDEPNQQSPENRPLSEEDPLKYPTMNSVEKRLLINLNEIKAICTKNSLVLGRMADVLSGNTLNESFYRDAYGRLVLDLKNELIRYAKSQKTLLEMANSPKISNFSHLNSVFSQFVRFVDQACVVSDAFRVLSRKTRKFSLLRPEDGGAANERIAKTILFSEKAGAGDFGAEADKGSFSAGAVDGSFCDQNESAVEAIKRVNEKLSIDPARIKAVVAKLIREANDEENLCSMYSGWAAWV